MIQLCNHSLNQSISILNQVSQTYLTNVLKKRKTIPAFNEINCSPSLSLKKDKAFRTFSFLIMVNFSKASTSITHCYE